MKRLLATLWGIVSSRALPPLVIGCFLLLYIGTAFVTEDALIALMDFTHTSVVLTFLLFLLPLGSAAQLVQETASYLKRRRALAGNPAPVPAGLFDETVEISAGSSFSGLQGSLETLGYHTRKSENMLAAWRGVSGFPGRLLYLAAAFCLFAGIFISLSARTSYRGTVIEGERFPVPSGDAGVVERITLGKGTGLFLSKDLVMQVAGAGPGAASEKFGLYPPSRYQGAYVYPRYLGVGLFLRFSAPDLPKEYETHSILSIYPPGKEAAEEITGSPYQVMLSLEEPADGSDPYTTGHMVFLFKLLKGKEIVASGRVPSGGEFNQGGYHLAFPDSRRLVIIDFIQDYGVILIWTSALLLLGAACLWLPIRIFAPRREMLFRIEPEGIRAWSRAEGNRRGHTGVFHESLDALESVRPAAS